MTTRKYTSRSQQTTLTTAVTSGATSFAVVSSATLLGGTTISAGQVFTVVIDPDTALEEVIDVTAVPSTNVLTVTRAIDGSTAQDHSSGAVIRHMIVGRDLREANLHIEATAAYNDGTSTHSLHGLSASDGNLVGTDKPQTLTAKTLTTPTIASFTNATHNHLNAAGGGTITAAAISDLQEIVEDTVGAMVSSNTEDGISVTYDDATGKYNFNVNDPVITIAGDVTGSATMTNLGNTTITTAISADTIVNADVSATAAIAKTKLDLGGTITSADLVDGTIVATDIANATITAAKMAVDPYARANHTGTQLAATVSDFDTQVRTSRLDQMAAPTGSVSVNSQKITSLATPTVNTDAATKLYVDTKVADLVNSAPGTLDTLGEIATAIQAGGTVYDSFVLKAGSTMTGALTLSGAPTTDLHAATKLYVDGVAGSATAAAASAAAAATTYDNFDDRYLGAKSTPPTLDNDGNALITGAIYWDSVSNAMFAWSGSAWTSISSTAAIYRYRYTATGGETSKSGADDNGLTLSYLVGKEQVYLNGVLLAKTTDYVATNGTSIASLAALAANDILEIITFTAFDLATAISNSLLTAKGDLLVATAASTPGKLTVGTNGQYIKADSTTATGLNWGGAVAELASANTFTGSPQTFQPTSTTDDAISLNGNNSSQVLIRTGFTGMGTGTGFTVTGQGAINLANNGSITILSTSITPSLTSLRNSQGTLIDTVSTTTNPTLRVRGVASQTADLVQFTLNNGTDAQQYLRINANGQIEGTTPANPALIVKQATTTYPITLITAGSPTAGKVRYRYSSSYQVFQVGQSVTIAGNTPSGYDGTFTITDISTATAGSIYYFSVTNATTGTATVLGTITPAYPANLQQWQDSTGAVLGSFSTAGSLSINGNLLATTGTTHSIASSQTATVNINIATSATVSGQTKTINMGTAGASGSTTNIAIGSSVSGATSKTTLNGEVRVSGTLNTVDSSGYIVDITLMQIMGAY